MTGDVGTGTCTGTADATDTAHEVEVEAATDTEDEVEAEAATDTEVQVEVEAATNAEVQVEVERRLEAILMVADEPQSVVHLATALAMPVAEVRAAIDRLVADLDGADGGIRRGFELREVGGGWRFYVRAEFDDVVRDFVLVQNPTKLSQAALETLAVISYKQPISRGAIASIRAVNVDSVVRTLLGRGLITEAFTDSETGAVHYATTELLLTQLGINSLDELPHISPLLADGSDGFDSAGVGSAGSAGVDSTGADSAGADSIGAGLAGVDSAGAGSAGADSIGAGSVGFDSVGGPRNAR